MAGVYGAQSVMVSLTLVRALAHVGHWYDNPTLAELFHFLAKLRFENSPNKKTLK
ncbi:hypothetical protein [Pareuzebyella sediminis]|uniref:hypothetical protein n=1 Tax=Pareuzebyella sediminis TaxID=2607998 RepID=UPI0018E12F1C|nr:hypothetical protein [Pareuzebyella sediminis]